MEIAIIAIRDESLRYGNCVHCYKLR